MIGLVLGIILIVIGIRKLYKSSLLREFYNTFKEGKRFEYKKIVGTVIAAGCYAEDLLEINKPSTPIVEYEVNGEKYEAQNPILETGAELPVGTKMYVWYKKDDPRIAVLSTELESYLTTRFIGITLIGFGLLFILASI